MSTQNLKGKTAYITGGSKGIGLGIAEQLAKEGIKVAITGRSEGDLEAAKKSILASGAPEVLTFVCDVRDRDSQESVAKSLMEKWGSIDVVVANAGVGYFGSIETMPVEQWNDIIDINLTGVFHTLQTTIPGLKKSEGYFITIASLAGTNFFANGAAYNASKFGLVGFTQAAMLDLRAFNIKVSTIMPGSVATYFNQHTPTDADAWKIQPEDIGMLVVDLLKMHPRTLPSKIEVRPSRPA